MKEIKLTKGKIAFVDDENYEWLSKWKWHFIKGYAARTNTDHKMIYMHREILKPSKGFDTDHINRNGLDNQRINLRQASPSNNGANCLPRNGRKWKGAYKTPDGWLANIRYRGILNHIGLFHTEEEAAKAYDVKAKELFGEFARLNFQENA